MKFNPDAPIRQLFSNEMQATKDNHSTGLRAAKVLPKSRLSNSPTLVKYLMAQLGIDKLLQRQYPFLFSLSAEQKHRYYNVCGSPATSVKNGHALALSSCAGALLFWFGPGSHDATH
jgi:hypothetical protein